MKFWNFGFWTLGLAFKNFFGLWRFFWDLWCLRSPVVCKNHISEQYFMPNSFWCQYSIPVHCEWKWELFCRLNQNATTDCFSLFKHTQKKSKFKTGEPNQSLQSGLIAIMSYLLSELSLNNNIEQVRKQVSMSPKGIWFCCIL